MKPDEREIEARRILARVSAESETIGTSNLARRAATPSPEAEDRIDRLGRIIGRTLGYAAVVALLIYLYFTYFAPA